VRDVLNAAGAVIDTNQFDGYGRVSQTSPSDAGRWGYDGQSQDLDLGIVQADGRTLLVGIGRWMQEDPISFDAGLMNLGDFVGNNPTNMTDPSGLAGGGKFPKKTFVGCFFIDDERAWTRNQTTAYNAGDQGKPFAVNKSTTVDVIEAYLWGVMHGADFGK